ncbi:hypothetical protein Metho_2684 (plasmid) [Methanomethylovorans hollandica DSM 15978]|jgi:hypothetical protein|uniref:Uncharacterized protein n=1 Tax=Methanomethylovorans hollandica (strain DSM 15978 / NBRC 107637 / DMS1) TaxID=867904 RepID=L0L3D0_METHD|nr:hypothetical protein Metho_2684 [Methanomethylovorans hollandica DSM 15978]
MRIGQCIVNRKLIKNVISYFHFVEITVLLYAIYFAMLIVNKCAEEICRRDI